MSFWKKPLNYDSVVESYREKTPDIILHDENDDEGLPTVQETPLPKVFKNPYHRIKTDRQRIKDEQDADKAKQVNLEVFIERYNKGLDLWSGDVRDV